MFLIILPILAGLYIWALYRATRLTNKWWLASLILALVLWIIAIALEIHVYNRMVCDELYTPTDGCLEKHPQWLGRIDTILYFLVPVLSLVVISLPISKTKSRK